MINIKGDPATNYLVKAESGVLDNQMILLLKSIIVPKLEHR